MRIVETCFSYRPDSRPITNQNFQNSEENPTSNTFHIYTLPPGQPAVILPFDLQNLTRSSGAYGYSL